jgi:hypothetical protein
MFLIKFTYDHYCQGWEKGTATVLVRDAKSFEDACAQIELQYEKAKDFEDLTI